MIGFSLAIATAFQQMEFERQMAERRNQLFEAMIEPCSPEKKAELRALRLIAQENRAETKVHVHNRFSIL